MEQVQEKVLERMQDKAQDRRVKKTRRQLRKGLSELLMEKSINEITVRELSDRVDINRGTFYLHYKDIFDMVDQVEDEMFLQFNEILKRNEPQNLNGSINPVLIDIFQFINDNADMAQVLLSEHGDISFVNKLTDVLKTRCFQNWRSVFSEGNSRYFELYYSYIVTGCIGLVQNWLNSGRVETPHEIARITERIMLHGIQILES